MLEESGSLCAGLFGFVFNMEKMGESMHSLLLTVNVLVFSVLGRLRGLLGSFQAAQTHS